LLCYSNAWSNPEGGNVVEGSATITSLDKKLNVHQHTDKTIINWQSFDIDIDEYTQFHQPSSSAMALNRVNSADPSNILGNLTANGNIILINPNGVFFGKGSVVDVNGIIATTADINNDDYMVGKLEFNIPGNPDATIENEGLITAKEAGLVGIVAPNVLNSGIIKAKLGKVQLASGDAFALDLYGDGLYSIKVSDDVLSQLVTNTGQITAEGGTIAITAAAAKEIVNSLIVIEGELRSPTIEEKNGEIIISGSNEVKISNSVIDVSGYAESEQGGKIEITGNNIEIENTFIDASGYESFAKEQIYDAGTSTNTSDGEVIYEKEFLQHENRAGGSIKIGGDYLGGGDTPTAQTVTIDSGTTIKNDAIKSGDGGRTIIWSDDTTKFSGTATAKGGAESGNGGFIETSGKVYLKIGNLAKVNTLAEFGKTGMWLLDPQDFTIASSGGDISGATLTSNLSSSDVTILSSGGGTSGSGDINVNDAVSWSTNTLTLTAARDININNVMTTTGTAALTMNTATTNGSDAGVSGGRVKVDLDSNGFNGRVDYSASGNLTINGNVHTVINSLGAEGSATGTDLQGIDGDLAGYYVLGSNIDASATTGWNAGAGFNPIGGTFTGQFNGLGHTISGLYIDRPGSSYIGLFSLANSSSIGNVGIVNADVSGGFSSGILVGRNENSVLIYNSYSTGDISLDDNGGGGLVGQNRNSSTITNSFSHADINNSSLNFVIGGLVGSNELSSTVSYSFATGVVTSNSDFVGGLVGSNSTSATVTNSYATGNVVASGNYIGGLIGDNSGATISYSHATGDVSSSGFSIGGLVGRSFNPSSISNSYAAGDVSSADNNIGGLVGENNETPINNSYATGSVTSTGGGFVGGLIGNNYNSSAISNNYATGAVSALSNNVGGLIGNNDDSSTISDSYATGSTTSTGGGDVGGLIGDNNNSSHVSNSYASGAVSASGNDVGGLIGDNDSSTVTDSYATGSTTSTGGGDVGGLIGDNNNSSHVSNSYASGAVSASGDDVGGLIGDNASSNIRNSYATGNVTSSGNDVGGLAGDNESSAIDDSYATGNVSSSGDGIGGLIGDNFSSSVVTNSYSVGVISGSGTNKGGLIGVNTATVNNNSFWDTETSGMTTSAAGTGKTTAQMQNITTFTNAGWDFDDDWSFHPTENNGYPVLRDFFTEIDVTLLKSTVKTYGDANPTLALGTDYSVSGCSGCLSLGFGTAMTTSTNAGLYNYGNGSIVGTSNLFSHSFNTGVVADYIVDYNYGDGSLSTTVKKATLTASLNRYVQIKTEKTTDFDIQFDGFKLNESNSVLNNLPNISLSANSSNNLESYDISLLGGADDNYTFSFDNPVGLLKILPKNIGNIMNEFKSIFANDSKIKVQKTILLKQNSNFNNSNFNVDINSKNKIYKGLDKPETKTIKIFAGLVEISSELAIKYNIKSDQLFLVNDGK